MIQRKAASRKIIKKSMLFKTITPFAGKTMEKNMNTELTIEIYFWWMLLPLLELDLRASNTDFFL